MQLQRRAYILITEVSIVLAAEVVKRHILFTSFSNFTDDNGMNAHKRAHCAPFTRNKCVSRIRECMAFPTNSIGIGSV